MPATLRALPRPLLALFVTLFAWAAVAGSAPAAHAATNLDTVAEALRKSPVYVAPEASGQLSAADAEALAKKIKDADKPVFVAVLPESAAFPKKTMLQDLRTKVGITGVYAVYLGGSGFNAGADRKVMPRNAIDNLAGSIKRSYGGDTKALLNSFVDQADQQAKGSAPASWGGGSGDDGIGTAGLVTGGAVVVTGGAGAFALYRRSRKKREERERAELQALRVVVDEDITAFGEELDRLDFTPSEPGADDPMREDYTRALDAYEAAKAMMDAAAKPQDVRPVTEALDNGRFALATLAARRTGAPLPERRMPCFFDPRHGPSATDAQWAPPGGAARTVPACAADAARLADGEEPMSRMIQTAHGPQPYWNAGPAYAPWAGGYFAGGILTGLLVGTMLGSMMSTPAYADSSPLGGDGPEGGDVSGADFNPGDFSGGFGGDGGGGDGFGGGDW
ncbi:hypothetical protein QMK19_18495 [Streptomyces sp. H10-C2]|uniref:hypothetical protein n=1 Tax=unclassified Streptomyces TaxID=2593676 RepID=UPI0024BAF596|nr:MULTISPECIES: hypothetical protein [unclassified Streptomyces]MDJ0346120.1 hypothetical protein [Streptomyces sp. PH10-H1]MDJ0371618.1 hypothetical protein [Streptomyces sp. H10-C2]